MLTKIKRIRRKKYAVGDEVRDFKGIPKASQPQQGGYNQPPNQAPQDFEDDTIPF